MSARSLFLLTTLLALTSSAATPNFLLGVDYTESLVSDVTQLRADKDGAIYVLSSFAFSSSTPPSTVTKLSADGKTMLWQNKLEIAVSSFAVDANGGVYVTPLTLSGPISVAKLSGNGTGLAWTKPTGITTTFGFTPVIAADSSGRVYVSSFEGAAARAVRISADGETQEYNRTFAGMPTSIVVDALGSAYVAGNAASGMFLTRLTPDGASAFYSSAGLPGNPSVALDPNGNALVYSGGVLRRFDPNGALLSSKTIATWTSYDGIAVDAAGNAYITGSTRGTSSYPVKNTLATCGTELLSVIAPDDTVLQTTYIPGAANGFTRIPLAIGSNSNVLLAPAAQPDFVPSREGPFVAAPASSLLVQLSTQVTAQTFPLACAVNGLSFQTGAIAPGEIVTLFGNGLGPETGLAGSATLQSPFPTKLADVQATVNGAPTPLLWAQDSQINFIAPWGLALGSPAEVCVLKNGAKTNCLILATAETAPGVATTDGVHAAVMNQDGTINSSTNPAPADSVVAIWVTGLGPLSPAQADGALVAPPVPANIVPSIIEFSTPNIFPGGTGTVSFPDMTYVGPAPFMVSGVTQINFRKVARRGSYRVFVGANKSAYFEIY